MFCQKCGSKIEGAAFCPSCGTKAGTAGGALGDIIGSLGKWKFDIALIAIGILLIIIYYSAYLFTETLMGWGGRIEIMGLTWSGLSSIARLGGERGYQFLSYLPLVISGLIILAAILKKARLRIFVAVVGIIANISFLIWLFSAEMFDGVDIGAYIWIAFALYIAYIVVARVAYSKEQEQLYLNSSDATSLSQIAEQISEEKNANPINMICQNCGEIIKKRGAFCPSCGGTNIK